MDDWDDAGLSDEARSCWAKFTRDTGGDWMPLHRHLSDTAAVAGRLWDSWLPDHVKSVIAGHLDPVQARALLIWLAGAHDLGKASPAFAGQVPDMRDRMLTAGFMFAPVNRRARSPHSIQSHLIIDGWLLGREMSRAVAEALACVPGGHHGIAPDGMMIDGGRSPYQQGDGQWLVVQRELSDWVADQAGIIPILPTLAERGPLPQAQVLLTAVVIVADWIASDVSRFPFRDGRPTGERVERAWSTLQLPEPWSAAPEDDAEQLFRCRFDLPGDAVMRPVQRAVASAARAAAGPELMIIEAPMGEGKTEAALLAAEFLAQQQGLGGCFIALPTMATSDAMFRRVRQWVSRLGDQRASMFLAHGKAALNEEFQGLVRMGRLASMGDSGESDRWVEGGCGSDVTIAHEWLSGRKKGVLANFVVGTIDQVLFSALRSRHLVLRHLALAGKVVVIDEVHSSDEYMGVFLRKALYWLAAYQVPTVLLSATLSAARRGELADAYAAGIKVVQGRPRRVAGFQPRRVGQAPQPAPMADSTPILDYPLLTRVGSSGVTSTPVPASGRSLTVRLETLPDDLSDLQALIAGALVDGGIVAVIRNTVRRAQQTATALRAAFPDADVVLTHSRFLAVDRAARDGQLRDWLGPPPAAERPSRMIVVGTQVLEQSLDIDFDLLVTDLAPVDLVLQRVGRLHRHDRPLATRARMTEPRCVLVGVDDWDATPPEFDRGSEAVYGRAALLRSAAVLSRRATSTAVIELPRDIPVLVDEASHKDIAIPGDWRTAFEAAEIDAAREHANKVAGARTYELGELPASCLVNWSTLGGSHDAEDPRGRARVRDGDDGLEVLVAQRIRDRAFVLPWIDEQGGREIPWDDEPPQSVARALATSSLRLPRQLTSPWVVDRVITELEGDGRAAWQRSKWLRGELFLFVDENLTADVAGHRLRYSREDGLHIEAAGD